MPYIDQLRLRDIDVGDAPESPGELNYAISMLCVNYVYLHGGPSYDRFNEVIGALKYAKQELYHHIIIPYEEGKMKANGDVY